jgi:hypothetical protein
MIDPGTGVFRLDNPELRGRAFNYVCLREPSRCRPAPWSFNRLSGDDEPGRNSIDFHCRAKIGRRNAGTNELNVVLSFGLQLLPPGTCPIHARPPKRPRRREAAIRKSRERLPTVHRTRSRLSLMRFYPYSPANAAQLDAPAPPRIKTVTVDPDDAFLDAILARLKPDFIRLHGKETPKRMVEIKEPLAPASSRRYRLARRRFRRDEIIRAAGGSLLIRQRGTAERHAAGRLCPRLRLEIDAWAEHRQTLLPIVKNAKAPVELPVAKAPDVSSGVFSREGDGPTARCRAAL